MRILHITTEFKNVNIGGVGSVIDELYEGRSSEEKFLLVLENHELPRRAELDQYPNLIVKSIQEYFATDLSRLADGIVFHNFYLHRGTSIPSALVSHSNLEIEQRIDPQSVMPHAVQFQREAFLNSEKIVFVSDYDLRATVATWESSPYFTAAQKESLRRKKLSVIHNGIRRTGRRPPAGKSQRAEVTFGFLGRLVTRKGIFQLISNFPNEDKLLIAGGGKNKFSDACFEKLKVSLNHRAVKNILPIGYCNPQRRSDFFHNIDALIIPSLYEPFGMTILESFDHDVPVIVSNFGGPMEILGKDYPYTFDPFKEDSLRTSLETFKRTKSQFEVSKVSNEILENFSVSKMLEKYRSLFSR